MIEAQMTKLLSLIMNKISITLLALTGVAFADSTVYDQGSIEQADYLKTFTYGDATVKYDSITSNTITINAVRPTSACNIEIGNIAASGSVYVSTKNGDITLGNAQADYFNISTAKGNIIIKGDVCASGNGSTIAISSKGSQGNFILDGATLSNVGLRNAYEVDGSNEYGSYIISGNTSLSNMYFEGGTVEVAEGATLSLSDVIFNTFENTNTNGLPAATSLVLGDNVTLTLNEGDTLNVKDLTIGSDVNIVIALSSEAFMNLDNMQFEVFSVVDGDVDFSDVNFTFTDGQQYKSGTVSSTGSGSISVTDTHIVPEPTTATLSLLALAALAARRRRR